ncbi:NAD(P)-dependent oxidoreductase [Frankia sp. AgB1.9]|uniref:NAD(P)-dependent oxidoreductase n=1 Tax=unclassified Frankia TaxID=2632575 RepID=UPI0019342C06|nr:MULTISPECIES: NAD(P)-dependent oxidoreductase [unclassified Frankia]MBL7487227.1 NAD(P)-dependent oxidoreductase [Frankia sp. AgW1.1]MBL7547973.1 NAD(P)-dependent oxidoreductase [Frankia sp. AgB1.9]MBL7625034.1 NAD(P)-dependent oxidoreductase [Frankia sp. AgB1.8]
MKIGFIGLGSMGLPMAQRLAAQGHDLTLYARRAASLEPFAGTGVTIAATPAQMGASLDAVGICVFDAAGVEEVLFGPDGLAGTLRPGAVVLVHSTVAPAQIRAIAERAATHGLRVLDAPVSGGQPRALTGELTIMIGGDAETLADVTELLAALSNHVVRLGDVGAGSHAKLINNTMFAAQIALADDAMMAGEALGVDPAGLAAVLATSSSACIASGVRLRAPSLAGLAESPANLTLTKDVTLMADVLGNAPGKDLVEVAQRFVAAMRAR